MRGIIFANGEIKDTGFIHKFISKNDFIIALDGGLHYSDMLGLIPHIIAGDFDSVDLSLLEKYEILGTNVIKYPSKKDVTDMEIGISLAVENNIDELLIFGALGKRYDHTLANILNLQQALENGIKACIIDESQEIFITADEIELNYQVGTVVSLLPLFGEVSGIKTYGLAYPLADETLKCSFSRGISNIFLSERAKIEIKSGLLAVIVNTKKNSI